MADGTNRQMLLQQERAWTRSLTHFVGANFHTFHWLKKCAKVSTDWHRLAVTVCKCGRIMKSMQNLAPYKASQV